MRVPDPLGEWKASDHDPRAMIPRAPDDFAGPFYRVYREGLIRNWNGRAVQPAPERRGLDFNRNFPVLLRPPSLGGDDQMNPQDLRLYRALGALCEQVTTYPCKTSYEAFFAVPGQPMTRGAKDWAYEHLGLPGFTMELWDLDARAGSRDYVRVGARGLMALTPSEREDDELKRLAWNDRELGGAGFVPWAPFQHPQLGPVEVGGWDTKFCRQNAPPRFLPEECRRVAAFAVKLGLAAPRVQIRRVQVTALTEGTWRVAVEVGNEAFMGTALTKVGADLKASKPVEAQLDVPAGVQILSGQAGQDLGHLEGWGGGNRGWWGDPAAARSTAWAEWVLLAPPVPA